MVINILIVSNLITLVILCIKIGDLRFIKHQFSKHLKESNEIVDRILNN